MKNSSNLAATLEKFLQLSLPANFYIVRLGRTSVVRAGPLAGLARLFIVGAIIGAPAFGGPIFFKNFVPDFYQHQKSGPDTNVPLERDVKFGYAGPAPAAVPSYDTTPEFCEQGGGWCCVAACVNSFYFLEKNYGI